MDVLTARVAEALNAAFGDEISDLYFADVVDHIVEAISRTAIADAEEALA